LDELKKRRKAAKTSTLRKGKISGEGSHILSRTLAQNKGGLFKKIRRQKEGRPQHRKKSFSNSGGGQTGR